LADARHATSGEASHMASAHATSVISTEATHRTCAEAATAVSAAEASTATTTEASATAATPAATRLRVCREQRPGQQGGRQYQHRSSSRHDIFLSMAVAISDHRTLAHTRYGRLARNR
jgi:hypothetical protein